MIINKGLTKYREGLQFKRSWNHFSCHKLYVVHVKKTRRVLGYFDDNILLQSKFFWFLIFNEMLCMIATSNIIGSSLVAISDMVRLNFASKRVPYDTEFIKKDSKECKSCVNNFNYVDKSPESILGNLYLNYAYSFVFLRVKIAGIKKAGL
uniref:Uncharacterized protein n=1 Tax=Rhizophagus irregularis (strain DAOM 181602 / DAOM 197198 / MUCL 43194) TaxID=747089 RepID=U9TLV2_RHIID